MGFGYTKYLCNAIFADYNKSEQFSTKQNLLLYLATTFVTSKTRGHFDKII